MWYGENASTCDIPRILGKLHVTPNLTRFTPLDKLQQKLAGLWLTDRHTPIIANILNAALRVGLDLNVAPVPELASYWHQYEEHVNWPNLPGLNDYSLTQAITYHDFDACQVVRHMFSKVLDSTDVDLDGWSEAMDNISDINELLNMPAILEVENVPVNTKLLAIVNEEIHQPPSPVVKPNDGPKLSSEDICWRFIDFKCTEGKNCKLAHAKVCAEFSKGTCQRKNCKFLHLKR